MYSVIIGNVGRMNQVLGACTAIADRLDGRTDVKLTQDYMAIFVTAGSVRMWVKAPYFSAYAVTAYYPNKSDMDSFKLDDYHAGKQYTDLREFVKDTVQWIDDRIAPKFNK